MFQLKKLTITVFFQSFRIEIPTSEKYTCLVNVYFSNNFMLSSFVINIICIVQLVKFLASSGIVSNEKSRCYSCQTFFNRILSQGQLA